MDKRFDSVYHKAFIFFGGHNCFNNSQAFSILESVMKELRRDVNAPEDDYYISFLGNGKFVASVSCGKIPNGYKKDDTCWEKTKNAFYHIH